MASTAIPTTYNMNEPSDMYSQPLRKHRSMAYKLGVMFTASAFIFFFTGFNTCNWMQLSDYSKMHNETYKYKYATYGLWTRPEDKVCKDMCQYALIATQIAFVLCLLGYIASFILLVYENFRKVDLRVYFSRKVELVLFFTGVFCCTGLFAFTHFYSKSLSNYVTVTFMWSMFLVSLSSTMLFIAWLLLLCGNAKPGVGVVVTQPPPMLMVPRNYNPSRGAVIQTPNSRFPPGSTPIYKPAGSAQPGYPVCHDPLLSAYPEPPPAYSLPPAYPHGEPGAAAFQPLLPPYSPPLEPNQQMGRDSAKHHAA